MDDSGLRGAWLRHERQRLRLTQRQVAFAVGVSTPAYVMIERYDRPVPLAWIAALTARGFIHSDGNRHVSGAWLRAERDRLGISASVLADMLETPVHRLIAGEAFAHDIPSEWHPLLVRLGFQYPGFTTTAPQPETIDIAAEENDTQGTLDARPLLPAHEASQRASKTALSEPTLAIVRAHLIQCRALSLAPLPAIARLATALHEADPAMTVEQASEAIGVFCLYLQKQA